MIESVRMRLGRSSPKLRAWCPKCDEPLPWEAPSQAPVVCPHCDTALIDVETVRFRRRATAASVDVAITLPIGLTFAWGARALVGPPVEHQFTLDGVLTLLAASPTQLATMATPLMMTIGLYFGLFWALRGQTPGGHWMRLRVIDEHGRAPSPRQAIVRTAALLPGLAMGGIGLLWPAFDFERRAWHDHIARTYVVRSP